MSDKKRQRMQYEKQVKDKYERSREKILAETPVADDVMRDQGPTKRVKSEGHKDKHVAKLEEARQKKIEENRQKEQEKQERQKKLAQRERKRKVALQKTRRGNPVMKNVISGLIEKIEKDKKKQ